MTMQSDNRNHGLANNLAIQIAVFVLVMAAVIVVASRYLWLPTTEAAGWRPPPARTARAG